MINFSRLNLNALRVFEAAARTGSFTAAAEELKVSQSAVSKQVATLESQLSLVLFKRLHRHIELTEAGRHIAETAGTALQALKEGFDTGPAENLQQIRLICDADFAQLWLLPRLPCFEGLYPHLRVAIKTVVALTAPPDGDHDCAIIWGRGTWRNHRFSSLMTNTVFPVVSPGYFDYLNRKPNPSDVTSSMLIHDQTTHWWTAFRAVTGVTTFRAESGRIYGQTALCLDAAANGVGIAIGDEVSAGEYLRTNRLQVAFNEKLPSADSYFWVQARSNTQQNHVRQFKAWLEQQVEEHKTQWSEFWKRQG